MSSASETGFGKTADFQSGYLFFVFAVYAVLLAVVVSKHEPWMDEAQAWLLAKDAGVVELFAKYLRYEGSPALWHLILMIPAKLGLPYFTLNVLSAIFSAAGVFLFLRCSPFPLVIKTLFPFSYFVFYQYGVVARSYCLISVLLFLIAINYKEKIERPFVFILLLCLLANVSTHLFLISGAILLVHIFDVLKAWQQTDKKTKIRQAIAVFLFGAMTIFLFLTLAPPADHFVMEESNWSAANFIDVCKAMVSAALVLDESGGVVLLQLNVSLVVFIATLFWLRRRKLTFLYLLPLAFVLAFFAVKYRNLWHEGILFFLWIFVLWISFEKDKNSSPSKLKNILILLIGAVLAVQIYWTAFAASYDFSRNYSGAFETAEFIKSNGLENKKIFASGWKSISVLPYFEANIFYNHNDGKERFWRWSASENRTALGVGANVREAITNQQPDVVLIASDHLEPNAAVEIEGYRQVKIFEGNLCWKTGIYEPDSYRIFYKR